jgi:hypothetical protein
MRDITLVTGDDVTLLQTLKKDAATFDMSAATDVKSVLLAASTREPLFDPVAQIEAGGADWSASLVEHVFPAATTALITYTGPAILETQVTLSGKKSTWFSTNLVIVAGTIE